jgi:hypothetical protein
VQLFLHLTGKRIDDDDVGTASREGHGVGAVLGSAERVAFSPSRVTPSRSR